MMSTVPGVDTEKVADCELSLATRSGSFDVTAHVADFTPAVPGAFKVTRL
jgi:hypothetical protein